MSAVVDITPYHKFGMTHRPIGRYGDRDLALHVARRIAMHHKSMADGSYVFGARDGTVTVLSESALTTPAYLARHTGDLVGLYGGRGYSAPSAGDIADDLRAHYEHRRFRGRRLHLTASRAV